MWRCGAGSGLFLAGAIVTTIGLGLVLIHTFAVPRHWTTLFVGVGLLGLGALRRAIGPPERREDDRPR